MCRAGRVVCPLSLAVWRDGAGWGVTGRRIAQKRSQGELRTVPLLLPVDGEQLCLPQRL